MNVLKVVPTFYPAVWHGGPILSVYSLCNALVDRGIDLRVLTTARLDRRSTIGPGFPARAQAGYPIYYCRRKLGVSVAPALPWQLWRLVRWADVVHLTAVYSFPTIPTLLTCRILRKPVVWSPRGSLQRWEGSTRPRLKSVWDRICRFIAPGRLILHVTSEQEARESRKRFPGVEAAVIPNGVHVPDEVAHVENKATLRLLYIGRIDPKKGIENLLEACSELDDRLPVPWSLRIAGSGEESYVGSIRRGIEDRRLSDRVSMLGHVVGEAKRALFEETDVVVVPSHTENFAMVVAEALAHGVPVIASKGTPWEKVEEEGCGLWVDNSPEALAAAIEIIGRMPLRDMGSRGREWMSREFGWHDRAGQMVEVYEKVGTLRGSEPPAQGAAARHSEAVSER